eukprot:6491279-Amphidinium_carterae.1
MPYRSCCPICVKAKGQSVHHRQGGLKEQSLIQFWCLLELLVSSGPPKFSTARQTGEMRLAGPTGFSLVVIAHHLSGSEKRHCFPTP